AFWGLSRIPSLPTLGSGDGPTPAATATTTPGEDATATDSDDDGTPDAPAAAAPLTFTAAIDYDPLGDGAERPEDLPRILDGDDSTAWGSEGYRSAAFSNLKSGIGVILDLGETSTVSAVTLVLPSESTGTLYVTDDAEYANDGKPLAEGLAGAGTFTGSGTVTTELAEGTSGRYVIVWFTEISSGGEQWYRARLAGASATS
ncbi:MAG: discoidin domain-containing protein, partial [Intrasporangiaceae bacterium]|nr:discoidin domain-containing protein [Intrasporangiaceae bacterium]